jgi:diguanylate cyclase (GGDEF)-like protein/PAS domain S-box-containing protein
MNPLTALCFVAISASLWISAIGRNVRQRHLARGLAAAVLLVAVSHLVGTAVGFEAGVDTWLFREAMRATGDGRPNTMAVAASIDFALLALALLNVTRRDSTRVALGQVFAIVAFALAQAALIGHAYKSGWFQTIGVFNRMALPTSAAFMCVSLGVLLVRRHVGVIAVASSDGPGGTLARGLLPAGFLVPSILGWVAIGAIRSRGSRVAGVHPELVVTLFVLSMIVIFVGMIAWIATQVHESHVERTNAEAALRDSEIRFRLLAENGSDVVSLHDLSGRVIYASPSCERIFGFSPDEMHRMGPFALVHPDDAERLRRHFDDLIRGAPVTAISCRMLHKTGKHLWIEMMWRAVVNREAKVVRLQASSRDITERKDYERQLEEARRKLQMNQESLIEANTRLAALATLDGLTGLKNRRAFEERLIDELTRAKRSGRPVTLLLLDIDHFKAFNDSFGHPRGDEVLRTVARHLSRSIRDSDVAARYGGEEFAIILPDTDHTGALQMGERLRAAIEEAAWSERGITVSVGAATVEHGDATIEALIDQADRALYRSKQYGRNRVTLAA